MIESNAENFYRWREEKAVKWKTYALVILGIFIVAFLLMAITPTKIGKNIQNFAKQSVLGIINAQTYTYSEELKTAEIKISGEKVADIKLETPQINYVPAGKDVLVAELTLNAVSDYQNPITNLELYDLIHNNQKISRDYKVRYRIISGYQPRDIYERICDVDEKLGNGTTCREVLKETIQEPIYEWSDFADAKSGETHIGIFADVSKGDKVEWVMESYGVKITEWAGWEEAMNTGLIAYYNFNLSAGANVPDVVDGKDNLTLNHMEDADWQTSGCKIANCLYFDGVDEYGALDLTTTTTNFTLVTEMTISVWFNYTQSGTSNSGKITIAKASDYTYGTTLANKPDGKAHFEWYEGAAPLVDLTGYSMNQWHHLVVMTNATKTYFYFDGALNATSVSKATWNVANTILNLGGSATGGSRNYTGRLDEIGIWNRSLTHAEIIDGLWNSGAGSTYTTNVGPVITLTSPINHYNSSYTNITFNCSADDSDGTVQNITFYLNESANYTTTGSATHLGVDVTLNIPAGYYNWTCTARDNLNKLGTTSVRWLNISLYSPTITLNSPANNTNTTINAVSFNCTGVDDIWIQNISLVLDGVTNYTTSGTSNKTELSTTQNLPFGGYQWTCSARDNYNAVGTTGTRFINVSQFVINSVTYNNNTISGSYEEIKTNLTYSALFTGIGVYLTYNNTNYSMATSDAGTTREYAANITVPSASNKTFYFLVGLSNTSGTYYFKSGDYFQNISTLSIDNCTAGSIVLFNLTMKDEETLGYLNGTIKFNMSIYSYNTSSLITSQNLSFEYIIGKDSKVCIANLNSTYTIAYSILHYNESTLYFSKYRNIQKMTISNTTLYNNLTLYNLLVANGETFKITVVGNSYSSNDGLLIEVQKQYLGEGLFRTVESPITDDDGVAIAHLVDDIGVYNFIISKNGVTLGTFNNYRVVCQAPLTDECSIVLNLAAATTTLPDYYNYGNVSTVFLLGRTNKTLYTTITTTDGASKEITQTVISNDGYGNTTICNNTFTGSSGTFSCVIPTTYQNTSFQAIIISEGGIVGYSFFSLSPIIDWGGIDIMIEILLFTCLVLMFLGNPVLIVIGGIIGMFFSIILFFVGTGNIGTYLSLIVFYIVGGLLIVWQIAKRH